MSMPSRAYTSFLPIYGIRAVDDKIVCQCPHGLIPHFYAICCSIIYGAIYVCQCPHGLIPHFYVNSGTRQNRVMIRVNALTGLYLISTVVDYVWVREDKDLCQCPHGLIPHFYSGIRSVALTSLLAECQCPHGLIPHFYGEKYVKD